MIAMVKEDAPVLTPNKEHKNFTKTDLVIPKGTEVEGEYKNVNGLRRGEPFTYKLFVTKENNILYKNKIEPMATQVYLGADAQVTPTVVKVEKKLLTTSTIVGGFVGAMVGNYYSKTQGGNRNVYTIGGAVIGFFVARYFENRSVAVKTSK